MIIKHYLCDEFCGHQCPISNVCHFGGIRFGAHVWYIVPLYSYTAIHSQSYIYTYIFNVMCHCRCTFGTRHSLWKCMNSIYLYVSHCAHTHTLSKHTNVSHISFRWQWESTKNGNLSTCLFSRLNWNAYFRNLKKKRVKTKYYQFQYVVSEAQFTNNRNLSVSSTIWMV